MHYSDADVNNAIDAFLNGGPGLAIEILQHLTPAQFRRYEKALEREEFRIVCRWQREWSTGAISEPPPTGRWSWPTQIPDTPAGLLDGDMP